MLPARSKDRWTAGTMALDCPISMTVQPKSALSTLLRAEEVLARLQVSRATFYRFIKSGQYPSPVRVGKRAVRWRAEDIAALMQNGIK